MSDSQLKQTISRLQSSAGATPRFPTWQNQPTPQAGTSWQNKDKKSRSRPTRTGAATPVAIAVAPGVYQQTGTSLYTQTASIPPSVPTYSTLLPSTTQALHTSYPSRLRTGATLLMQPILVSQSIANKAGRAAKRINYAEAASGDEDMEVDVGGKEIDSDDSDFMASGGIKTSIRREGSRALGSHQPSQQANMKGPLDQSYLGSIPPSRFLSSKPAQPTRHGYVTPDVLLEQARKPSTLIPIRVEIETETHRIRDAFVWNLNEQIISPAAFARIFCADLDLPSIPYAEQIEGAIRSQIEEWESVASLDLRPPLPQPSLEDPAPFYSVTNESIDDPKLDEWNPELLGEEYQEGEGEEVPDCRVILEIDVQIATQHLLDHIEWDLVSPLTPEHFARTLCNDLGLSGESVPLIAHAIHEEILRHKRDAIEWGVIHTGDAGITAEEEDKDRPRDRSGMSLLKDKTGLGMGMGFGRRGEGKGPRPLRGVFRDWSEMEDWGTSLEELTAEEVERREIERERAASMLPSSVKANIAEDTFLSQTSIRTFLRTIRSDIETLEELENVLLEPLAALELLPDAFDFQGPSSLTVEEILNAVSAIQHSLLTSVLPVWFYPLTDSDHLTLFKLYLCPANTTGNGIGVEIARNGLSNILSYISTLDRKYQGPRDLLKFCLLLLQELASLYPPDVIFQGIFITDRFFCNDENILLQRWEDYVRNGCSVPGKVLNIIQDSNAVELSPNLEYGSYFSLFCLATERVMFNVSQRSPTDALKDVLVQAISHLLLKLVNQGLFPSFQFGLTSQPSFFTSTLPTIQQRIRLQHQTSLEVLGSYTETWCTSIQALPLLSQRTLIKSLLSSLDVEVGIDVSSQSLRQVRSGVTVLRGVLGDCTSSYWMNNEIMKIISAVLMGSGKTWDLGLVRAIVCWVADPHVSTINEEDMTSLLLMTLAAIPRSSNVATQLSLSSSFISSISTFLSHSDISIRQCGMLVAEIVAERCNQKLNFDGWDGSGEHLEWVQSLRKWTNDWGRSAFDSEESKADISISKEIAVHPEGTSDLGTEALPGGMVDSDDDSLSGYSSSHRSSRPPSPTPSELDEMEKDPTLRVGQSKPIPKPVYLAQLVSLFRKSNNEEKDTADIIEVILSSAELLIRRKKGFGYELEENAVELTIALLMLRNNYDMEDFNEKRQAALVALVECCPKKTAQTLVEQFFTNQYSTTDRLTMLTALAFGARTLAGLVASPTPGSSYPKIAFPSKLLPPALHHRYATQEEIQQVQIGQILGGITQLALEKSKSEVEDALITTGNKDAIRTRMLKLGSTAHGIKRGQIEVLETTTSALTKLPPIPPSETFTVLAAEYFIMPLINHMWLYLRDTDTRIRKDVAGTGMILDTNVLAHFLSTLAVLVHDARNSTAFLAIIAPASIEIAITLGSRPIEAQRKSTDTRSPSLSTATPATVLTAALELALFSLDASATLDDGRTLALENAALIMALSSWAGEVLNVFERGHRILKGGGETESKLNAVAAGVVIRVEKIVEKWGRTI
ncbi:hypothetical protein Clacol_007441 [Clathrus columnatus]|uniref:Telomere length regulation protein conserved domain-containing protein n=1 Tax=Clathrus columnatus TaxID=1419009 RepID=A0AAV5AK04_9AGAM|nr:hypothetical protein Clacol_007441 [Clathrus columnatus]